MSVVAPYDYAPGGEFYAAGDGPELFAYAGEDDSPLWKQFCEGILVGVGVTATEVYSLDDAGRLDIWNGRSGQKRLNVNLGAPCSRLTVSMMGTALAITARGVAHIQPDGQFSVIQIQGATAAAFSADATRACVGTSAGVLVLYDLASGAQLASTNVGDPVADLAFSPRGVWVAAAGKKLVLAMAELHVPVEEGQPAKSPILGAVDVAGTPTRVTVNVDGTLAACDDGAQTVLVYELKDYHVGATIVYARDIGDIQFGPDAWLGIGLEYADCNRVDVITGKSERSKPGLGRGTDTWYPRVKADNVLMRGAMASMRAGGMPIATVRQVQRGGGANWMLIGGITAGIAFLCCGGLSIATTLFVLLR